MTVGNVLYAETHYKMQSLIFFIYVAPNSVPIFQNVLPAHYWLKFDFGTESEKAQFQYCDIFDILKFPD